MHPTTGKIYVADDNRVRTIDTSGMYLRSMIKRFWLYSLIYASIHSLIVMSIGLVNTIVGLTGSSAFQTGVGTNGQFDNLCDVHIAPDGNYLYLSDRLAQIVAYMDLSLGRVLQSIHLFVFYSKLFLR